MRAVLHGSKDVLDALERSEPEEVTEAQAKFAEEALQDAMRQHEANRKKR